MRDPDLIVRAQRAATALESAWCHWRNVHGLTADPLPTVSSYVGYSLEAPWGEARIVFGVCAAEAEQLTALLDLRLGRAAEAKQIIKSLVQDPQVPPGIRQTSQDLLMTLDATPGDDTNSASKAGTHG